MKRIWIELVKIYRLSATKRLLLTFRLITANSAGYGNHIILEESNILKILKMSFRNLSRKLRLYLKTSIFYTMPKQLANMFSDMPIKTISVLLTSAIVSNTMYFILFKLQLNLLDWFIRISSVIVLACGVFSKVSYKDIKNSSLIFRIIAKIRK